MIYRFYYIDDNGKKKRFEATGDDKEDAIKKFGSVINRLYTNLFEYEPENKRTEEALSELQPFGQVEQEEK